MIQTLQCTSASDSGANAGSSRPVPMGSAFQPQPIREAQPSDRRQTPVQGAPVRRRRRAEDAVIPDSPKPDSRLSEESGESKYVSPSGQTYTVPQWLLNKQHREDLPVMLYSKGRDDLERTGNDYRNAGFPDDLVAQAEWELSGSAYHKRRGAQYAAGDLGEIQLQRALQQAEMRARVQLRQEQADAAEPPKPLPQNPFLPLQKETEEPAAEEQIVQAPEEAPKVPPKPQEQDLYAAPVRLKAHAKPLPNFEKNREPAVTVVASADSPTGWQVITEEKKPRSRCKRAAHWPQESRPANAATAENPLCNLEADRFGPTFNLRDEGLQPPVTEAQPDEPTEEALRENRLNIIQYVSIGVLTVACLALLFLIGRNLLSAQDAEQTARLIRAQRASAYRQSVVDHPFRFRAEIERTAAKYNLSPAFVAAIVLNESSFRTDATSSVGARGLMQLMDDTAFWIYGKIGSGGYDFDTLYDAETNLEYGCWYLNYLSNLFRGDPILVAAAFHAGQGEISNWLNDSRYSSDGCSLPLSRMPEGPTRTYVGRVTRDYADYQNIYYVLNEGGTL